MKKRPNHYGLSAFTAWLCLCCSIGAQAADTRIDFATNGDPGNLNSPVFTDPATGLEARGLYLNADGDWIGANLYRRNVDPTDHGFGVCNPLEEAADNVGDCPGPVGGGEINELDNDGASELIVLKLPDGFEWVSVQISSLDEGEDPNQTAVIERGQLWADQDGIPGATPGAVGDSVIRAFTGGVDDPELVIQQPFQDPDLAKAPYLIFEPFDHSGSGSTDNDYLVFAATVASGCQGTIGDFVWNDLNGNGIQESNEPGIPGVKRILKDKDGNVIDETVTDNNGFYEFSGLVCPATYIVEIDPATIPDGFAPTLPEQGNDPAIDSNVLPAMLTLTEAAPDNPTIDCGFGKCEPCDGKVVTLSLRYDGSIQNSLVSVTQKKDNVTVFDGVVQPGETFTFTGADKKGTLGTEITVEANGVATKIHTSCSQDIGPGLVFGDFTVMSGTSRNGGLMCPFPPQADCGECKGKVNALTLKYLGATQQPVTVTQKDGAVVFSDTVAAGGTFSFVGTDKKGTLGTEITIDVNGAITRIHTSCSQPIGAGAVFGDFEVIEGSSREGGKLCPVDMPPPPPPGDDTGQCEGKVTTLTLEYDGPLTDTIEVVQKKGGDVVFSGNPDPDGQISFVGTDKKGTLSTEIIIKVNGVENTRIHTSCSQPIGPGLVSGSFTVISGTSRNGGVLPPI